MIEQSGQSSSIWAATTELKLESQLSRNISGDVCIVGAGIAGMTTAYLLCLEGKSVVVLDQTAIGGGQTARTTAHLTNAVDDRYFEIERLHGVEAARLTAESHSAAISKIERIVAEEHIDCDFERLDGYLFMPPGASTDRLDREWEAARQAGLEVDRLDKAPLPVFHTGPCLRFPNQGQFQPLKYLAGLTEAIRKRGGRIFTETRVTKIEGGANTLVKTEKGATVQAASVVVATNTPINDLVAIHTKQAAYRSYVIAAKISRGSVFRALYWDTGPSNAGHPVPYHYCRLLDDPDGSELLIVGGEDHKTGQTDDEVGRYTRLESWTRERFPIKDVVCRWSGQVLEPVDGIAFIGRNPMDAPNVYVATGDSGMGMTHGTIAGILLTDLILGRENPWSQLYEPSRKTLRAAWNFMSENLNVAAQYGDWVSGSDVSSLNQIGKDMGAIVRDGLSKLAVYRDPSGTLHQLSAACPHLGCVVEWNATEKTWDCPCHGSRFDCFGHVLNGPANKDLVAAAKGQVLV
jgi:glycine/D-amino acid oxidase-like deaminating enzyme/nitrite reductase/ring-hydroxylating ferredoxin subunit